MSYTAPVYLLQPGQRETIPVVGREIAVIEADKDFLIAVNSGEPHFITAGLQLRMENVFSNIVLRNPHAEAITVRLGITDGAIKDNRASVSATLPVRDPGDLSSFSDVIAALADVEASQAAILAMMQNANDQRIALKVTGQNSASGNLPGSAVMIIDPSLNLNGAVFRHGHIVASAGTTGGFFYGSSAPANINNNALIRATNSGVDKLSGYVLEAGKGVWVFAAGGSGYFSASWDYLT